MNNSRAGYIPLSEIEISEAKSTKNKISQFYLAK